jgi:hypothetical protein
VLGDEQVLDVELDRNTELLPVNLDFVPPSWEKVMHPDERLRDDASSMAIQNTEPGRLLFYQLVDLLILKRPSAYFTALRSLVPLVPMTMKGAFFVFATIPILMLHVVS